MYTVHEIILALTVLVYRAELPFIKDSRRSIKALEDAKMMCPIGNVNHTFPQLLRAMNAKFRKLPPDKLKNVNLKWLSSEAYAHEPFEQISPPRLSRINDIERTSPDLSGSQLEQIPFEVAVRRIKEVHYDRGAIVDAIDFEAKEMADCRKRHKSFNASEQLQGKAGVLQLSQLGFFFVGDCNSPGKLRCSFCRCSAALFICSQQKIFLI